MKAAISMLLALGVATSDAAIITQTITIDTQLAGQALFDAFSFASGKFDKFSPQLGVLESVDLTAHINGNFGQLAPNPFDHSITVDKRVDMRTFFGFPTQQTGLFGTHLASADYGRITVEPFQTVTFSLPIVHNFSSSINSPSQLSLFVGNETFDLGIHSFAPSQNNYGMAALKTTNELTLTYTYSVADSGASAALAILGLGACFICHWLWGNSRPRASATPRSAV